MSWISSKKAAELLCVTYDAVHKAANKGKYTTRYTSGVGRGGRQLEILLESLPQPAQDRYHNIQPKKSPLFEYSAKMRDMANWKAYLVDEYRFSGLSPDAFVERHNKDNPNDIITKSQLFRWQKKRMDGNDDIETLIDGRGGYNRGCSSITQDQWEFFEDLYLRQQKISIKRCWELTSFTFDNMPSVATFERRVRKIGRLTLLYYREGPKAFNDALPRIRRKKEGFIFSNDIWFSDHHELDVFVKNKSGKIVRLWLTAFMDARSNKIVAILVRDADPNTTAVKQCLRIGMEQYGVPRVLYVDNGADYKSKEMTAAYPLSLCQQLGIGHIFATPYHPEAKGAIERFFGILEDRFGRLWPTYAGSDAKKRPEVLRQPKKQTDAYLQKHAPDMDIFIESLNTYIEEYNKTPSGGVDMFGKCPDEIYYSRLQVKREAANPDVLRMLCGRTAERVVQDNFVRYENQYYTNDILLDHVGERVYLVFDPEDVRTVSVFDMEGRAICTASEQITVPFGAATEEDYRRAKNEIKAARKAARTHRPAREMDVHQIVARNKRLEQEYKENGVKNTVTQVHPKLDESIDKLNHTAKKRRMERGESALAPYTPIKKAEGG